MNFSPNKTPIEIIGEAAFVGIYFWEIQYKNSWKEFVNLKNTDAKFYALDY